MYIVGEDGPLCAATKILSLIMHIFKVVVATVLKPGLVMDPTHFCHARGDCEYHTRKKKIGRFMPHFGASPFEVKV